MPLSLICRCGARIELEDALAGQEVACPECQQPLERAGRRRPQSAAPHQRLRAGQSRARHHRGVHHCRHVPPAIVLGLIVSS